MSSKTITFNQRRLFNRRSILIVLVLLLVAGGGLAIIYLQIDARSQVNAARHVDAIIVLGSKVYAGERAGPSLSARIQHAITLYKAGYAPYMIFCGGVGDNPPSEAEVMRRVASSAGVSESAMILEDRSHSTEENLANAKALMDARGLRSAIIVSDPFHLFRAEIMARDLGIDAYGSGANKSPTYTMPLNRFGYTMRESIALVWYYGTMIVGKPLWLARILQGKM